MRMVSNEKLVPKSQTVLIRLSVHSLASSLASLVTSSEDSAMAFAMEISSLLLPLSSWGKEGHDSSGTRK